MYYIAWLTTAVPLNLVVVDLFDLSIIDIIEYACISRSELVLTIFEISLFGIARVSLPATHAPWVRIPDELNFLLPMLHSLHGYWLLYYCGKQIH